MLKTLRKKAQGMVEYAILLAGVSLVAIASVSILGEKTAGLIATTAFVIPGAQMENNGPIYVGELLEVTSANDVMAAGDAISVDLDFIRATRTGVNRVNENFFAGNIANFPDIIVHN